MHAGTQGLTPMAVEASLDADYRLLAGGYGTGKSDGAGPPWPGLAHRSAIDRQTQDILSEPEDLVNLWRYLQHLRAERSSLTAGVMRCERVLARAWGNPLGLVRFCFLPLRSSHINGRPGAGVLSYAML